MTYKPQAHQIMTIKNQSQEKPNHNTKESACVRRSLIEHQTKMYLERGGKITKLPDYDDNHDENRPRACGFGGGSLL